MKEASSSDPPDIGRLPRPKAHGSSPRSSNRSEAGAQLPLNDETPSSPRHEQERYAPDHVHDHVHDSTPGHRALAEKSASPNGTAAVNAKPGNLAPAPSPQDERAGTVLDPKDGDVPNENENQKPKRTWMQSIRRTTYLVITHSWLNVLLVFVPIGIAVAQIDGIHGGIVFAMNCIAIIPLAGMLAFATEAVARKMGDALGALLNVTFGNAVELIIFMYVNLANALPARESEKPVTHYHINQVLQIDVALIALVKNEIRIVQASLLGSILANLLLILGMSFFLGGLRYREQIYNSTVTQMSACLLSLSVISLVLPTAFHASFKNPQTADDQSLKISRGTSVILLLVYIIYLGFQLKSHAYMYESTPQHIVDAESTPGPASAWLDSSSSDSSSSSSSDSDDSDHSKDTMRKKMKKVLRSRRRRKSSFASIDTDNNFTRASSITTASPLDEPGSDPSTSRPHFPRMPSVEGSEEAVEDEKARKHHRRHRQSRRHKHKKNKKQAEENEMQPTIKEKPETYPETGAEGEPRRVDFAVQDDLETGPGGTGRRPFPALRGISVKNLAPTVFVQKPEPGIPPPTTPSGPVPRVRYGIRRTNSLPDRLHNQYQFRPPGAMLPSQIPLMALNSAVDPTTKDDDDEDKHLSQISSIVLLLVSTALVAVCAEFLVDSIEEVVSTSSVGEIFIGLIILPIVGNAAEHVTAITVAMKNKMDLSIGVAVGSSIQIAIFITPLVVIIGWCMDREMTLYFTLFETVCLFVSAFIVNFLVLDGRSNYLEGALLCAVYVIIGVLAFFYPDEEDASSWGQ